MNIVKQSLLVTLLLSTPSVTYSWWNPIEAYKVNEAVKLLTIALTPTASIPGLPAKERDAKFKEKAHAVYIEKNLLIKLHKAVDPATTALSPQHCDILRNNIATLEALAAAIDVVPCENPFENTYKRTAFDEGAENYLVDSLIVTSKPDLECSLAELKIKKEKIERGAKILELIKTKGFSPQLIALLQMLPVFGHKALS